VVKLHFQGSDSTQLKKSFWISISKTWLLARNFVTMLLVSSTSISMIHGICLVWQRLGKESGTSSCQGTKKHGSGGRPNRTTEKGFWKATGSDRKIVTLSDPKRIIGLRKTLVFYQGRAPRGCKTDWVMNEYRLPDNCKLPKEIVLCKIYRKATSLKVLEQRAALEEEREKKQMVDNSPASPPSSTDTMSFSSPQEEQNLPLPLLQHVLKKESETTEDMVVSKQEKTTNQLTLKDTKSTCGTSLQMPFGKEKLPDLQLPMLSDWTQDTFWAQLNSPWLQNFTPTNILNFY